jgi:hypothetical protein
MRGRWRAALAGALCLAMAAPPSLADLRDRRRVVIVFAPDDRDLALAAERTALGALTSARDDRDLTAAEVVGTRVSGLSNGASELRRSFHAPLPRFKVVLIGKDGHVALESAKPLPADALAATIDAMPMRQDEMREAHGFPRRSG